MRGEADDVRHVGARAGSVRADDVQTAPDEARDLDRGGGFSRGDRGGSRGEAGGNRQRRERW